jgi:methyl-accepting chemotaxis protein
MALFEKLRIGGRLRLAFGAMFVAILLTGGAGLYQSAQIDGIALDLAHNGLPGIRALDRVLDLTTRLRQLQAAVFLAPDAAIRASMAQTRLETLAEYRTSWQVYERFIDTSDERQLADKVQAGWADFQALDERLAALLLAGDRDAAMRYYAVEAQKAYLALRAAIVADQVYNDHTAQVSADLADVAFARAAWMIGIGAVLAGVLAAGSASWINRNLTLRVVRLAGSMRQLAGRDYGFDLPDTGSPDEIGDMARAVDACREGRSRLTRQQQPRSPPRLQE